MKKGIVWLLGAPRRFKQVMLLCSDFAVIPVLFWFALVLRYETSWPPIAGGIWPYLGVSLLAVVLFMATGVYRAVVRAFDEQFLRSLVTAISALSVILFLLAASKGLPGLPRSSPFVLSFFAFLWVWGSRSFIRSLVRAIVQLKSPRRVAIYGAGSAGRQLTAALRSAPECMPVAFIDDNPQLVGAIVSGLRVYAGENCEQVLRRLEVSEVLIAMPSASRARRREVIERLEPFAIHVRSLPSLVQLVNDQVSVSDIHDVEIADLLGRDAVPPSSDLLGRDITGKCVMVTGAGGSIGSELCRQVLDAKPSMLLLWEVSEYALYSIEQELKGRAGDIPVIPVLGSVLHGERLARVMERYGVDTVYHAAAYKHVPLVEWNPFEGVINNAIGTKRAAEAAIAAKVSTFVLISTDKAVRPTNVMGASKRLSELVLQAYAAESECPTRFCMVRFGNVLGSSGSVVPLFREQIARGGPVTVTHPGVTRYFMTIPEAAQLVIQAGAMGKGGDVFVLDMGESVRIQDLARKMIHLSGMSVREEGTPNGDIEIVYSGLRPGEKLYEELLIGTNVTGTDHPRIMRAMETSLSLEGLESLLDRILVTAKHYDVAGLKQLLKEHVDGYVPDLSVMDIAHDPEKGKEDSNKEDSNIVPLKRAGAISAN